MKNKIWITLGVLAFLYLALNIVAVSNDQLFSYVHVKPLGKALVFISSEYDNVHLRVDKDKICTEADDYKWNAFVKNDITPRRLNASIEDNMGNLEWGVGEFCGRVESGDQEAVPTCEDYKEALEQAKPVYATYNSLNDECNELTSRWEYRYGTK